MEERLTEMHTVKTRPLGGLEVSALGLGCDEQYVAAHRTAGV
jgi:hypothetical protein